MAHRPRVGDECWVVRWCVNIPVDEYGESDLDAAEYREAAYKTPAAAWKRAIREYPNDAFGAVVVTPMTFVAYDERDARLMPHVGYWEPSGDAECYHGEPEGGAP